MTSESDLAWSCCIPYFRTCNFSRYSFAMEYMKPMKPSSAHPEEMLIAATSLELADLSCTVILASSSSDGTDSLPYYWHRLATNLSPSFVATVRRRISPTIQNGVNTAMSMKESRDPSRVVCFGMKHQYLEGAT